MNVEVVAPDALASRTAAHVAELLQGAVSARGQASLAVSGGSTPAAMFAALAAAAVPWSDVHLFQVDERIAADGDPARNLEGLRDGLVDRLPTAPAAVHPMPVTDALSGDGADAATAAYEATLRRVVGTPPALDVVHLGLGDDGHTASLVPDDVVLDVADRDVAVTGHYRGHRRMTLTYPALARARHLVWLIAGTDKGDALRRLVASDTTIPGGRVPAANAVAFTDVQVG